VKCSGVNAFLGFKKSRLNMVENIVTVFVINDIAIEPEIFKDGAGPGAVRAAMQRA
jgi:hypothetical protein